MPADPSRPDWLREIEELHAFFEDWLGGTLPENDPSFGRMERVMAEDFTFVTPGGRLFERDALLQVVREGHGSTPGLRIAIRHPRLLHADERVVAAVYREEQEVERRRTARISTVLFRRRKGLPNGLAWLHVQETWLAVTEADPV